MRWEPCYLLVCRSVPAVGGGAEGVLDDGVGAPLVAGRAVGVAGVDLGGGLGGGLPEGVEQHPPAGGDVAVAAVGLGPAAGDRLAEFASAEA